MSSHALSVSGRRSLSTTTNDDARTSAQMPAKPGDAANITAQGFVKLELSMQAPEGAARLERRRVGHRLGGSHEADRVEYMDLIVLVLEIPEEDQDSAGQRVGVQLFADSTTPDGASDGWPHTNVDVRKGGDPRINYMTGGGEYEVVETVPLSAGGWVRDGQEDQSIVALAD